MKDELGFLAYETRFHTPSVSSESHTSLYYSYEVAGLHVVMLGCYTDFDRHSKQYKWLKKDLAKVDRSRTPWLIVGMHAPWYNSNVAHQGEVESMRSSMETLLFENGVDAVFAGKLVCQCCSSRPDSFAKSFSKAHSMMPYPSCCIMYVNATYIGKHNEKKCASIYRCHCTHDCMQYWIR